MSKTRILVVENEAIVAEDIKGKLESFGYEVPATALSGEEAVKLTASVLPDLILMDIRMPGKMDGVDAAMKIRGSRDIPVIFLTAFADKETIDRAKITEPFGCIVKPFTERDLQTAIEIALYKHRMEIKLRQSETKYRELVENLSETVFSLDLQGRITYVSPVIQEIFGYTAEELTGRPLAELIHPDDQPGIRAFFQNVINHRLYPHECRILTKGGDVRWIRAQPAHR